MTWWRRALHAIGWILVLPMAAFVVARVVAWDGAPILVALDSLTAFVLLPAWLVLVLALIVRRRQLGAAAVALILIHAYLMWPELSARRSVPAATRTAPRLVVFDANVRAGNLNYPAYARAIRAARPDLVVLEEASPAFGTQIILSGAVNTLLYSAEIPRADRDGLIILCRYPLSATGQLAVDGSPIALRATISTPAGPVRLLAVHTQSPFHDSRVEWKRDLAALRGEAKATTGPMLVIGDFNATWGNEGFRRLLSSGFQDAAAARGDPFQWTWPTGGQAIPPVVRIDHVLTRGSTHVTAIHTGTEIGSDHRPLIATVALR